MDEVSLLPPLQGQQRLRSLGESKRINPHFSLSVGVFGVTLRQKKPHKRIMPRLFGKMVSFILTRPKISSTNRCSEKAHDNTTDTPHSGRNTDADRHRHGHGTGQHGAAKGNRQHPAGGRCLPSHWRIQRHTAHRGCPLQVVLQNAPF